MSRMRITGTLALSAILIGAVASGCTKARSGGLNEEAGFVPVSTEPLAQQPVKLRLLDASRMPDAMFKSVVTDPLQKRLPEFTVERIAYPDSADWSKLPASESPDLALVPLSVFESVQAEKDWLDVSAIILDMIADTRKIIQPSNNSDPLHAVEKLRGMSGTYGLLPPGVGASLYFDKDIFDTFGIPYPQAGLTWSETKELTSRLTRADGDKQYVGFAADRSFLLSRMSMLTPLVDPNSERIHLMTEKWMSWLSMLKPIYDVPGMELEGVGREIGKNRFIQKRDVAMWAGNFMYPPLPEPQQRLGRIPLPSFDEELERRSGLPSGYLFAVPKASRHPAEALYVVAGIVDTQNERRSDFEPAAVGQLGLKFADVLSGEKDLNTAFREAEEVMEVRRKAGQVK